MSRYIGFFCLLAAFVFLAPSASAQGTIASGGVIELSELDFPAPGCYGISLPPLITSATITDAKSLCTEIGPGCAAVTKIVGNNSYTWDGVTCSTTPESGCISPACECFFADPADGYGYMVDIGSATTWSFYGSHTAYSVTLPLGSTTVSLPWRTPLCTAEDILTDIGTPADSVARYVTSTCGLEVYTGISGNNFTLQPGEGYVVTTTPTSFVWTPPRPPQKRYRINGNMSATTVPVPWVVYDNGIPVCNGSITFTPSIGAKQIVEDLADDINSICDNKTEVAAEFFPGPTIANWGAIKLYLTNVGATGPLDFDIDTCLTVAAACSFNPTIEALPPEALPSLPSWAIGLLVVFLSGLLARHVLKL